MGPRGGDEINLLLPGRNYGWPLTSKGVEYDGTPVEYGKDLGITFDLEDIEQPLVDLAPSPAVSSFAFYEGDAFPAWRNHMLVGSLRATDLFRVEVDVDGLIDMERLITDLARIRDVESGVDVSCTSSSNTPPAGGSCGWCRYRRVESGWPGIDSDIRACIGGGRLAVHSLPRGFVDMGVA